MLPGFVGRDLRTSPPRLTFKNAFNIALAMKNPDDVEGVLSKW